jgi:BCCT family betaine/carnitine transporter
MNAPKVDKKIFIPSMFVIAIICVILAAIPAARDPATINKMLGVLTYKLTWLYLFFVFAIMVFLGWIAFSRYGRIKLGDTKPQFSTLSWISMIFCASIGSSILYWGSVEWAYYYMSPPFRIEPFLLKLRNGLLLMGCFTGESVGGRHTACPG